MIYSRIVTLLSTIVLFGSATAGWKKLGDGPCRDPLREYKEVRASSLGDCKDKCEEENRYAPFARGACVAIEWKKRGTGNACELFNKKPGYVAQNAKYECHYLD